MISRAYGKYGMLYLFFMKNSNRNVIVGASTLTAGNIKKGVKIFNVTGTFTGWVDSTCVIYQSGSATTAFPYLTRGNRYTSFSVTSSWILINILGDNYTDYNGIMFDLRNFMNRQTWMWIDFSIGTDFETDYKYFAWSRQIRSSDGESFSTDAMYYYNAGFTESSPGNQNVTRIQRGTYTRCDAVELNGDPCGAFGPCFETTFTYPPIWVRLTKIWLTFQSY